MRFIIPDHKAAYVKINIAGALCENEDVNFLRPRQTWQMLETGRILRNVPKSNVIKFEPETEDLRGSAEHSIL